MDAAINDIKASHNASIDGLDDEESLFLPEVTESASTHPVQEIKQEPKEDQATPRPTETPETVTEQPIRNIDISMLHVSKKHGRSNEELQQGSTKIRKSSALK